MNALQNKGKIFAIANQKGGVGKTTTAVNLATALSAVGQKVLLVDLDPQGNASTGLGVELGERKTTIYDVIINGCDVRESIVDTQIPDLALITATVDLSGAEIELVNVENRELILKSAFANISNDYDYIIIDCPPSLGLLTINALVSADNVIIPLQCEFFALEGLSHLLKTIQLIKNNFNPDLDIHGIVLTMYDKRNNLTEQVELDVRHYLGSEVYNTVIPRNVKISEAPSHGKPAIVYDYKCPGSNAYMLLAREVLEKEGLLRKAS